MKSKYLWYTDTHLDKIFPWSKFKLISHIMKENPNGVFLSGDISNGFRLKSDLISLAKNIKCPIYFVLGNHDYHFSSMEITHSNIKEITKKYSNLIWLTESDIIPLSNISALIGIEGWYDAMMGDPKYLRYTVDWFMIKDFRILKSMKDRIEYFRYLANKSALDISLKLQQALDQKYKTIYLLTHFPPWKEATRDIGTFMSEFWLPYNTNITLGKVLKKIMKKRNKRHLMVLSGHTHTDRWIFVKRNIECKVNKAKYYGNFRNEEIIFV